MGEGVRGVHLSGRDGPMDKLTCEQSLEVSKKVIM